MESEDIASKCFPLVVRAMLNREYRRTLLREYPQWAENEEARKSLVYNSRADLLYFKKIDFGLMSALTRNNTRDSLPITLFPLPVLIEHNWLDKMESRMRSGECTPLEIETAFCVAVVEDDPEAYTQLEDLVLEFRHLGSPPFDLENFDLENLRRKSFYVAAKYGQEDFLRMCTRPNKKIMKLLVFYGHTKLFRDTNMRALTFFNYSSFRYLAAYVNAYEFYHKIMYFDPLEIAISYLYAEVGQQAEMMRFLRGVFVKEFELARIEAEKELSSSTTSYVDTIRAHIDALEHLTDGF